MPWVFAGGICVQVIKKKLSHKGAEKQCESMNAQLAEPTDVLNLGAYYEPIKEQLPNREFLILKCI